VAKSLRIPKRAYLAIGCCLAVVIGLAGFYLSQGHAPATAPGTPGAPAGTALPVAKHAVCGQPVLDSPYRYAGNSGSSVTTFASGAHGLPTYGSAGTDYPHAKVGYIVPAGNNSGVSAATLNANNVLIYFEPGDHVNLTGIQPGNYSVFLGGYSPQAGEAEIDNGGHPGNTLTSYASYVTIEYLTIAHFDSTAPAASFGGAIVDEYGGYGWTVDHDTVGPNGDTLGKPYTGYGVGVGSNSTYDYDCITRNGEGGFNNGTDTANLKDPAPWGGPANYTVEHDEISDNAIATCGPTFGCHPGVWGDPDGVAAGLKVFWSLNGTIDYNYIHDNYGSGLWPDTNNSGLDISYNYISDNFSSAITYEASVNANITHNVIIDNGWNPKGPSEWAGWPNGFQTSNGGGPDFVDGAIYIDNSGGASNVQSGSSRYLGQLNIIGNDLIDNFGGIAAFQDRNRFCGEGPDGGAGACPVNGRYSGGSEKGSPYYTQPTSYTDDATVSVNSTTITTAAGFKNNYTGSAAKPGPGWVVAAYDPETGKAVPGILPAGDTIASCASKNSCALTRAATAAIGVGHARGKAIEIESGPPGGCGMYDLMGSSAGQDTGSPRNPYFANCNWWVQYLTVTDNSFSMNANPTKAWKAGSVTDCLAATGCGYMVLYANQGACTNGCFWSPYAASFDADYLSSKAAHNVWSDNRYTWSGPGAWSFEAGGTGHTLSRQAWRGVPYGQDSGSSFSP
jgi:hypothetical protein